WSRCCSIPTAFNAGGRWFVGGDDIAPMPLPGYIWAPAEAASTIRPNCNAHFEMVLKILTSSLLLLRSIFALECLRLFARQRQRSVTAPAVRVGRLTPWLAGSGYALLQLFHQSSRSCSVLYPLPPGIHPIGFARLLRGEVREMFL